mmetsp:Transcript_3586/g.7419  ORF Transcript_3586/g.7419 Transcript_3586/m.7419 type:complete len:106 (+) Transcript_3586:3585-3902(+)
MFSPIERLNIILIELYLEGKKSETFFDCLNITTIPLKNYLFLENYGKEIKIGRNILKKAEKILETIKIWKIPLIEKRKGGYIKNRFQMSCIKKKLKKFQYKKLKI